MSTLFNLRNNLESNGLDTETWQEMLVSLEIADLDEEGLAEFRESLSPEAQQRLDTLQGRLEEWEADLRRLGML